MKTDLTLQDRALEPGKFCNVYVRNLGSEVTEATLADAFGEFGPISSTVVMRNAAGKSRGFGFVNFEQAADAANAVANMDGHRSAPPASRITQPHYQPEDVPRKRRRTGLEMF